VILFRHLGLELEQSVGERYLSIPPSGESMGKILVLLHPEYLEQIHDLNIKGKHLMSVLQ
jgi:hypothetical protein